MTVRAIRERDDRGALIAAGCEWAEHKDSPGLLLYLLTWAGVAAALLGLWVALVGDAVIGTPIVLGAGAVAWWSRRAGRTHGQERRTLVFRADDTAVASGGLLPVKVSAIAEVAFDLQYDTPYIALVTKDGRRVELLSGRGLEGDNGLRLHAELVKAWDEMTAGGAGGILSPCEFRRGT